MMTRSQFCAWVRHGLFLGVLLFGRAQQGASATEVPTSPSNTVKLAQVPVAPLAAKNGPDNNKNPRQIDSRFLKKLDNVYIGYLIGGMNSAPFLNVVKNLRDDLPEVAVSVGDEVPNWQKIEVVRLSHTLNTGKHLVAAFKFRSPLSQPADLHWAFAIPESVGEWYIVPAKGELGDFKTFKTERNLNVPDVPLPAGSLFVFQELMGGRILPGEDYIVWYVPPDGADQQMYAALKLTPAGTHKAGTTAAQIRGTIGINAEPYKFPSTAGGLRDAYSAAHRMVDYRPQDLEGVTRILRSVWNQIPEAQVAVNDEKPLWNQLTPDLSFRFHAVRFKSTSKQPADLFLSHATRGEMLRWQLISQEESFTGPENYWVEPNCPIPGIQNPDKNLVIFQRLTGGKIQPEGEYAVWFAPTQGALVNFDFAARLAPTDAESKQKDKTVDNSQLVARQLGLEIPSIPTQDRVDAALNHCLLLSIDGKTNSLFFRRLLEFARPSLPVWDTKSSSVQWKRIELNQNRQGIAAYRLDVDWQPTTRLTTLVARPSSRYLQLHYRENPTIHHDNRRAPPPSPSTGLNWGVINPDFLGIGIMQRRTELNVSSLSPMIPADYSVDYDVGSPWGFKNKASMLLVFAPVSKEPMTIHAAVKFESGPKSTAPTSVLTAIKELGLDNQTSRKDVAIENDKAILGRHAGTVSALRFISNDLLVSGSMDCRAKFWNLKERKEVNETSGDDREMFVKDFSPDGKQFVATGIGFDQILVFDSRTRNRKLELAFNTEQWPLIFRFTPDGNSVVGCYPGENSDPPGKSKLYRWDLQGNGSPVTRELSVAEIRSWIMLPDGKIAMVGSHHSVALAPLLRPGVHSTVKGNIEFLDGLTLATQDSLTVDGPAWADITCSGDGSRFGTLASNGWMTVWDAKTRKPIASFPQDNKGFRIVMSNSGHRVAARTFDGDVRVWDVDSRRCLLGGVGDLPRASSVALSPNGELLAVGAIDFTLRVYPISPPSAGEGQPSGSDVLTNSIGLQFNWIPSGKFEMGRSKPLEHETDEILRDANQKPRHLVQISRPFFMGRYEVTVAQFRKFVQDTGYRTTAETSGKGGSHITTNNGQFHNDPKLNWQNPGFPQQDDHPVVQVSYNDATAFCEWLTKKEKIKFRLPTEAEWEYACRAGTSTKSYHGDGNWIFECSNTADKQLSIAYGGFPNAYEKSDGHAFTAPVGSYVPNGFALFDMNGNVWEWCSDWYQADYYKNSPVDDPSGPKSGEHRVQRGSSFFDPWGTSSNRESGSPDQTQSHLGFRVVREIPQ